MTHTGLGAPPVAIVHDVINKPGRVLPHPGAVFHGYASVNTPWVAQELSHSTPMKRGNVSSNSLGPVCVSTFKCLFNRAQLTWSTWALIDIGRSYHLGAPDLWSRPLSTFPPSILHFPRIALPSLQLCQPFNHRAKPQRTSIDRRGRIVSGIQPLVLYR
jgi:hypothetical protein